MSACSSVPCGVPPTGLSVARPDLHAQVGDADGGKGAGPRRHQAAPVPAVPQELLLEPPAGAAHPRAHRREAVQMFLLRAPLQAALPRAAAHATAYR